MRIICGSLGRKRPDFGRSPAGFTLIELVVVIGVTGLLIGLLLPAVQSAREAARRVQCVANMKQIGIAMQSYHEIHNMFPPSSLLVPGKPFSADQLSELLFLLPQLEQTVLFNSINMAFARYDTIAAPSIENHTARHTRLAVLLCPSDGEPNHLNSYRFNRGRYIPPSWSIYPWFDGPFSMGELPSASTITDGLSRTAVVSERLSGSFVPGINDPRRDLKAPNDPSFVPTDDSDFITVCLADQPGLWWNWTSGRNWFYSGFVTTNYNHNGTPNDRRPSCVPISGRAGGPGGLCPPRSFHPQGVNVLFGDAHVEFITDSVQESVWIVLGTYNAGDF
jgi:prepilin-type N-terminal cleavage/methylation domain-containing protein/prepilin-type processing-associated H-X9-DG protein